MLVVPPDGRHLFLERGPQGHRVAVLMSHDGQGGAPAPRADDCDVCHKPNRLSDESEPPIVRTAFVSLYHKAARNAALLSPERLCPFRSGSMVSQPSEILDFRLRREVIIPQKQAQANDVYRYESAPRCRTVYAGYYTPPAPVSQAIEKNHPESAAFALSRAVPLYFLPKDSLLSVRLMFGMCLMMRMAAMRTAMQVQKITVEASCL